MIYLAQSCHRTPVETVKIKAIQVLIDTVARTPKHPQTPFVQNTTVEMSPRRSSRTFNFTTRPLLLCQVEDPHIVVKDSSRDVSSAKHNKTSAESFVKPHIRKQTQCSKHHSQGSTTTLCPNSSIGSSAATTRSKCFSSTPQQSWSRMRTLCMPRAETKRYL
jgi:hypothetical protein